METVQENITEKLIGVYENLAELQKEKERILISREIDKLSSVDEKIVSLYNHALEISKKRELVNPDPEQVEKINTLYLKISGLEKSNQDLIEHSLNLINKIFTGIMKMVQVQTTEYNQMGKTSNNDDYRLFSVSEEA